MATLDSKPRTNRQISWLWIVLVGLGLIGMYAAIFIPALAGRDVDSKDSAPLLLWTTFFFWLLWKRRQRKGWHGVLIGLAVATVSFFGVGFLRAYALDHVPIETQLARIADLENRSAPTPISADVRFDHASAGPASVLTYHYTFVHFRSTQAKPGAFDTKFAPLIRKTACKASDLKPLLEQNVVLRYEYRGIDGGVVGSVSVDRRSCESIS